MIPVAPGIGDAAALREGGDQQDEEENAVHGAVASKEECLAWRNGPFC
jgi:hypothetical protein